MINFPRYEHQSSKRNKWKWESIVEKLMLGKRCLKMRSPSLTLLRLTGWSTGIVNNKNGSRWLWIVQDNSLMNCPRQFTHELSKTVHSKLSKSIIQMTLNCRRQIDPDHNPKICPDWPNWLLLLFLGRNTSSLVTISPFLIWHLNMILRQCFRISWIIWDH